MCLLVCIRKQNCLPCVTCHSSIPYQIRLGLFQKGLLVSLNGQALYRKLHTASPSKTDYKGIFVDTAYISVRDLLTVQSCPMPKPCIFKRQGCASKGLFWEILSASLTLFQKCNVCFGEVFLSRKPCFVAAIIRSCTWCVPPFSCRLFNYLSVKNRSIAWSNKFKIQLLYYCISYFLLLGIVFSVPTSSLYNSLCNVHVNKESPAFDSLRGKILLSLQHVF